MRLFLQAFIQVFLVSVNTYFIAQVQYAGVLIAAFGISYVWSHNVKKVAFGSEIMRIIYASGAACGAVAGVWVAQMF